MLDFTSALYLGLRHPSNSLRPWASLSTGVPAALQAPPGETKVAKSIAALLGQEQALLAPSTLHLVWDLFGVLSAGRFAILIDDGTYPISRWGAERAAARGVPIRDFAHHDISQVSAAVTWAISMRRRPFLVTDGFCPGCGRAAPLPTYLELLGPARGELFIDDTQALGILGSKPSYSNTYGVGGRGTLAWHGVEHREAIVVCSLAKGFGAPIACLAGPERWVSGFARASKTRVHTSPPSAAAIAAAERALDLNAVVGERRRERLRQLVRRFRRRVVALGLRPNRSQFPVQSFVHGSGLDPAEAHSALQRRGIKTVLHRSHKTLRPAMSFLITAGHSEDDIDQATVALAESANIIVRTGSGL